MRSSDDGEGIGELVKETLDGVGHLVAEHVRLAKLELLASVSNMSHKAALVAAVAFAVLVGYLCLVVGAIAALETVVGLAGAAFIVGGVHVVGGVVALVFGLKVMARASAVDLSIREAHRTISKLSGAKPTVEVAHGR